MCQYDIHTIRSFTKKGCIFGIIITNFSCVYHMFFYDEFHEKIGRKKYKIFYEILLIFLYQYATLQSFYKY